MSEQKLEAVLMEWHWTDLQRQMRKREAWRRRWARVTGALRRMVGR